MNARLDHVNLSVTNLNESITWYGQVFGFEKVEGGVSASGLPWGIVARGDSMICMSELPVRERADVQGEESRHRVFHFGLRVDDLEAWRLKVDRLKLPLYYGGEIRYSRSRSWYVRDPSGHEIEVSYAFGKPLRFPPG